jgi:hypothetical protein
MPAWPDLIRTAGNVFLTPVVLSELPGREGWRRALVVGSGEAASIAQAAQTLRRANRGLSVDPRAGLSLWQVRRRRYDLVCLLLTGEGRRREKLLGMLAGAKLLLACNRKGQWYQVRRPAFRPLSLRWWCRLVLAGLLSACYLRVMVWVRACDLLWRLAPMPRPIPDPGPPAGRTTTFIVPAYNQRHLMDFCLAPLLAEAGPDHEVILVDDASTDGTAEYVREQYPRVRVLRLARNRGFAGAVRAGIAASQRPLFALINTDVQVQPGFLRALLPHFDHEDTFAVCSRIELPDGSQMETGNVAPAFSGMLEPYHLPPTRSGPILYAGGASSVFHRARYQALGGFETIYRPIYWEDIELGYRAWRRGWRSVFEPGAWVRHERRAWVGQGLGEARANETFQKNGLLFVWKNLRDRGMLAQHWVYVCARLYREVLAGERMMCYALLRALPLLPAALIRRWREHHLGDLDDRDILAMATPLDQGERQ